MTIKMIVVRIKKYAGRYLECSSRRVLKWSSGHIKMKFKFWIFWKSLKLTSLTPKTSINAFFLVVVGGGGGCFHILQHTNVVIIIPIDIVLNSINICISLQIPAVNHKCHWNYCKSILSAYAFLTPTLNFEFTTIAVLHY